LFKVIIFYSIAARNVPLFKNSYFIDPREAYNTVYTCLLLSFYFMEAVERRLRWKLGIVGSYMFVFKRLFSLSDLLECDVVADVSLEARISQSKERRVASRN
jgi:hypothetical protein